MGMAAISRQSLGLTKRNSDKASATRKCQNDSEVSLVEKIHGKVQRKMRKLFFPVLPCYSIFFPRSLPRAANEGGIHSVWESLQSGNALVTCPTLFLSAFWSNLCPRHILQWFSPKRGDHHECLVWKAGGGLGPSWRPWSRGHEWFYVRFMLPRHKNPFMEHYRIAFTCTRDILMFTYRLYREWYCVHAMLSTADAANVVTYFLHFRSVTAITSSQQKCPPVSSQTKQWESTIGSCVFCRGDSHVGLPGTRVLLMSYLVYNCICVQMSWVMEACIPWQVQKLFPHQTLSRSMLRYLNLEWD